MLTQIDLKIDNSVLSDKLVFLIAETVKLAVDEYVNSLKSHTTDLVSRARVAKRLGITKDAFDSIRLTYDIQAHNIDGDELFIYKDVLLAMRAHTANMTPAQFKSKWLENLYNEARA